MFQFFQKMIRVVAFLLMEKWCAISQCRTWIKTACKNGSFVQLTTSLHRNDGHQSRAALHRSSGRSDSKRRRGARGSGLVPDMNIQYMLAIPTVSSIQLLVLITVPILRRIRSQTSYTTHHQSHQVLHSHHDVHSLYEQEIEIHRLGMWGYSNTTPSIKKI